MQGVLSGGIWGLVVGGVAAAGVSLLNETPVPQGSAPVEDIAGETPDGTDTASATDQSQDVDMADADADADMPEDEVMADAAQDEAATSDESDTAASDEANASDQATESAEQDVAVSDDAAATETQTAQADEQSAEPQPDDAEEIELADAGVTAQTSAPTVTEDSTAQSDAPRTDEATQDAPVATDSPTAVAPAASEDTAVVLPETGPAEPPETAPDVAVELTAPSASEAPDVVAGVEDPVLPNPQGVSPEAPSQEASLDVDTAPTSDEPAATPEVSANAPEAEIVPGQDAETVVIVGDGSEAAPLTPQSPISPATPDSGDANLSNAATQTATAEGDVIVVSDDPIVSTLPGGATPGVRVNRLGASSDADTEEAATDDAADDAPTEFPEGTPAIVRFAADYDNPEGLPEVSVILVDDGSFDGAVASLAGISFPVTVILNPGNPGSTERMKAYRAAGIEVGVLANLPTGARPADVAVFYEAAFSTLPETVAVLDASGGDTSSDADTVAETVLALAEDGRGLITASQGLNSSLRVAEAQGVPTSIIYRDLDGEGQDARVIRRFLDQAAFRARQNTGVVLLGQIRGDTISALIQWGAANRASQVSMAPISAVLNKSN